MPKRLCNGREQHERARKIDDIDSRVQIYASRIASVEGFSTDFTAGKVMMMMIMMLMFALGCLLQAFGGRSRSPVS
ncbi:hypothetical protein T01_7770 [Trichinella spiralis]|uniref:Uncharacterized protein n=1 Tax=Trichinella spiralis TaxID=6334 RepID=A0A0V1BNP6_TRISP|nr:hypothetical protein T01_7770 [Trichinella spiralis]